jgi:hypothetical protein
MTSDVSMLADFAVRLVLGMAALLLMTSWKAVPLSFFRTHCQIILALLVLAALDAARLAGPGLSVGLLVSGAVLAYIATVSWGLGLPRLAAPATCLIVFACSTWLILASRSSPAALWAFSAASRFASAFLLGSTLTAMLLGHHYLTAPTMSIEPLTRFVLCIGGGLLARGLVAVFGLILVYRGLVSPQPVSFGPSSLLMLSMRWGMGFAGPAVAAFLAWRTVQIRSTQSATGILYVALALVLFGELSSLIGARGGGLIG